MRDFCHCRRAGAAAAAAVAVCGVAVSAWLPVPAAAVAAGAIGGMHADRLLARHDNEAAATASAAEEQNTLAVPSACDCEGFCAGQCSLPMNATPPVVLDLFRLTPANVTDLTNKNSGDAEGDTFFVINEYDLPLRCANGSSSNARGCFLDVSDVIMRFDVEVDGRFGPYLHCNPPSNGHGGNLPGNFSCAAHGTSGPPAPPQNTSTYCACARTNRTVGEQRVSMQFGSYGGFIGALSRLLDGLWLSTTSLGQCGPGEPVGSNGCSWRVKRVVKVVNATCVQSRLYRSVEARNAACFASCPGARPPPALPNRSTACAVGCFQDAALRLSAAELVQPWSRAFASDDPSDGGCPPCALDAAGAYACPP